MVRGKPLNVQIELTIADEAGGRPPEKKTVTMLVADQAWGRIRGSAATSNANGERLPLGLNVDARPLLVEGDDIRLELVIEFAPLQTEGPGDAKRLRQPTALNESLSVILRSGKPLMISQAADPISDRRVTVEVKATVLK